MSEHNDSNTQERVIIATVVILAAATLVIGAMGLKRGIFGPFLRGEPTYKTPEQRQEEALAALRVKDTDLDSLSDYDELYLYRTSPYLEDSDSDGESDADEIFSNSDPNCPKGKTCIMPRVKTSGSGATSQVGSVPTATTEGALAALSEDDQQAMVAFIEVFGDPTELTKAEAEEIVGRLPADDLRRFFIQMGVPQDQVSQADPDIMRELAIEALDSMTFLNDQSGPAQ